MLRWLLYSAAGLGVLVVIVLVVGWSLPVAHSASRSRTLRASPEEVFAVVSAFGRHAEWRSNVARVEAGGPGGVGQLVREHGPTGEIPYRVEVLEPPRKLVTRIAGDGLPFGGTWTYAITATPDGGSTITITEDGEIYNPLFRFMARFVFGYHATMDRYLEDLAKTVGT
jgi:uncharacterized protein YndB with AHSA1/START domain